MRARVAIGYSWEWSGEGPSRMKDKSSALGLDLPNSEEGKPGVGVGFEAPWTVGSENHDCESSHGHADGAECWM